MGLQHFLHGYPSREFMFHLLCLSILPTSSEALQVGIDKLRFYPNATLRVIRADLLHTDAHPIDLLELSAVQIPADAYTPLQTPDWYAPPLILGGLASGEYGNDEDILTRTKSFSSITGTLSSTANRTASGTTACNMLSEELMYSIDGLSNVDQRLANGGREFNREPPDQALCCGNGFLIEGVNSVLRVRDANTGKTLTGTIALNSFFGYKPEVERIDNDTVYGQYITDPSCLYDAQTQRFFFVVASSPVNSSTGSLLAGSTIDIAVSTATDPTGCWHIYRIPAQSGDTNSTPDHNTSNGAALADYPKISTNEDGLFISTVAGLTNGRVVGVSIYAISKWDLATGTESVEVVNFLIHGTQPPHPYAVIPAQIPSDVATNTNTNNSHSNDTQQPPSNTAVSNSTMQSLSTAFFVSTQQLLANGRNIAEAIHNVSLWSIRNTHSLNGTTTTAATTIWLEVVILPTPLYNNTLVTGVQQKNGTNPLGLSLEEPQPVGTIESNEAYIINAMYANGKIWGAFMTTLRTDEGNSTGAVLFHIDPIKPSYKELGILSMSGQHLLFPTVAVNGKGQGAVIFTLTGPDFYPTTAYAMVCDNGVGPIKIVKHGQAPQDGFKQYPHFKLHKRWGDYGGAAVSEQGDLLLATEYISSGACGVEEFNTTNTITRCNGTRTSLTNWATTILRLHLQPQVPGDG